jgi:sigma-E factor negative regulatory protein RseB
MPSTIQNLFIRALIVCCALFAQGSMANQQPASAYDLVVKMFDVSKQLNYQGVFTHETAGDRTTVKVLHQVIDGVIYERATYMDGPEKERIKVSAVNRCQHSDFYRPEAREHYRFDIIGETRVAGRSAYRVKVLPKDSLRFGYLYAIDKKTGLMLKSSLVNQSGRYLEHFKYVDINMDPEIDLVAFQDMTPEDCAISDMSDWVWSVGWVPAGFVPVSQKISEAGRMSVVYTDGVAVFSVLIDRSQITANYPMVSARLGPTQLIVVNQLVDQNYYTVAVSGQLPQVTASQIARSISPSPAGQKNTATEVIAK